jgi:nitroreductase
MRPGLVFPSFTRRNAPMSAAADADFAARVEELMRSRRTVKPLAYDARPVADALVWSLLEAARWAPSHGLTQPWRFLVFTGDARARLGQWFADSYRARTPAEKVDEKRAALLASVPGMAPCVIAIVMARQVEERIPEVEELAAVACAVQNMQLLAAAHGLGTFWQTGEHTYDPATAGFLELAPNERCLGFLYLGYPKAVAPAAPRTPIADKVRWHTA